MVSVFARTTRTVFVAVMAALLCTALLGIPGAGQDQLPDEDAVRLIQARSGHTATLLDDDYVLIAGGSDGQHETASVEVVDPIGMAVEALGSLLVPRADHTATLLPDGRILVAGGRGDGSSLRDVELLDPLSGQSQPTAPMIAARAAHGAVLLDDGRVLFVGGVASGAPVAGSEIYDPVSETLTEAAPPSALHLGAVATLLPDGRVLLTGPVENAEPQQTGDKKSKKKRQKKSKEAGSGTVAAAEIYDPVADEWTAVTGGGALSGHEATSLTDGRVLLAGGTSPAAELYDPAVGSFSPAVELATPRADYTSAPLPDGRVLIAGGANDGSELATLEVFDPAEGSFAIAGEMLIPRTEHSATALSDGRVLIAGGSFAGLALDDLLVFDPADASLASLSVDMEVPGDVVLDDPRTKADIRAAFGAPESFATYYFDELEEDGSTGPTSMQTWTYYGPRIEFTFDGDTLVAEDAIVLEPETSTVAAPYDPDQFTAYMLLDEVIAAAGIDEYLGAPADELIEGGEIYFGRQLTWGMKDGELRYIESLALGANEVPGEAD